MSIYIPEENEIYFSKTREYFQEVLSSYSNKNYRSATVMLYSVAICDILFKLQELRDMHNDSIAESILKEIEKSRNIHDKKSKSLWEKELIDKVHKDTNLLHLEAYTNLNHLYDHRNFSAHPALNDDYELISPSQETTIANIKNILNGILIKPPIFIKNILTALVEDISQKKFIYENEYDKLEIYLNNKYFSRMPNSMKIKVYTALWKFCFCMPDDPDCKENRKINRMALSILSQDASLDILTVIKNAKNKFTVSGDEVSIKTLIVYLSSHVKVYNILSEEVIHHIDSVLSNDDECKLISWFKFNSLNEHLNYILTLDKIYSSAKPIQMLTEHYIKIGEKELLIDFYIHLYGVSQLYDIADNRFDMYISPNLSEMSKSQVEHLIKVSSNNDQIFARRRAYRCNTMIVEKCKGVLGENFDYDNLDYSFNFDKKILDDDIIENHNDSADFYDEDGELLF